MPRTYPPTFLGVLFTALAIGAMGGILLAVTRRYSRHGLPSVLVYGAVLITLGVLFSHTSGFELGRRVGICVYALMLSVLIAMFTGLRRTGRTGAPLPVEMRLLAFRSGSIPWGLALLLSLVVSASAGVAWLSS